MEQGDNLEMTGSDGQPLHFENLRLDDDHFEKEAERRLNELSEGSQPLYELTHEESFRVISVLGENYEVPVDGFWKFRDYGIRGGYATRLTIQVTKDEDHAFPVKTLIFNGTSPVEMNNHIIATIPRYEGREGYVGQTTPMNNGKRTFYHDRPYQKEETAIELNLVNRGRTDKSINYQKFKKRD